jgi:hypothetical protein
MVESRTATSDPEQGPVSNLLLPPGRANTCVPYSASLTPLPHPNPKVPYMAPRVVCKVVTACDDRVISERSNRIDVI